MQRSLDGLLVDGTEEIIIIVTSDLRGKILFLIETRGRPRPLSLLLLRLSHLTFLFSLANSIIVL